MQRRTKSSRPRLGWYYISRTRCRLRGILTARCLHGESCEASQAQARQPFLFFTIRPNDSTHPRYPFQGIIAPCNPWWIVDGVRRAFQATSSPSCEGDWTYSHVHLSWPVCWEFARVSFPIEPDFESQSIGCDLLKYRFLLSLYSVFYALVVT